MNKRTLIITAYIIFMASMVTAGYHYQTKENCQKQSTKDDMGITHPSKCEE